VEHQIILDGASIGATADVPPDPAGAVIFAHGSGSSRFSTRNRFVATQLRNAGFAALLIDLLSSEEAAVDERTAQYRFDISFLARRLIGATHWFSKEYGALPVGYFGASTGAAAALVAAAALGERVRAVVSRGGRPDLAGETLARVAAPTLLIVGEHDPTVVDLNYQAARMMTTFHAIALVPNASHLFEEPGALERVAELASAWFVRYVAAAATA